MRLYEKIGVGLCVLLAGCTQVDSRVAGLEQVRIVPIDWALTRQLAAPPPPLPQAAEKPQALTKLAQSEPAEEIYRLGAGDVVSINIYAIGEGNNGDLVRIYPTPSYSAGQSEAVEVPKSEAVHLPYAGDVMLRGKTLHEVRDEVQKKVATYFKQPQVEVKVVDYRAHRVALTGEVTKPGEQIISNKNLTVLQALEAAGGATNEADLQRVELRRQDGQKEILDLQALLYRGDASQNRVLRAGDALHLPTNHRNKVFLLGEVVKPEAQSIAKGRLSLTESLSQAGGLDKITASKSHVYVIRGAVSEQDVLQAKPATNTAEAQKAVPPSVTIYQLDASSPAAFVVADQFMLQPRDVVYVSEQTVTQWSRFVNQLIPGSVQSLLYGALYSNNNN